MSESKLITKKELIERHPALGERPYRLDWLIRTRQIPIHKPAGGRRIYFDLAEIDKWIRDSSIPVQEA